MIATEHQVGRSGTTRSPSPNPFRLIRKLLRNQKPRFNIGPIVVIRHRRRRMSGNHPQDVFRELGTHQSVKGVPKAVYDELAPCRVDPGGFKRGA